MAPGQGVAYNAIAVNRSTCTWLGQSGTPPIEFLRAEEASVGAQLANTPPDNQGAAITAARAYPKGRGWYKIWWEDPFDADVAGARVAVAYHYGDGCIHHSLVEKHAETAANVSGVTHWHVAVRHWSHDHHCSQIYSSEYVKLKNTYFIDCNDYVYAHIASVNIHVDGYGYGHSNAWKAWVTGGDCKKYLGIHYAGWIPPNMEVNDPYD